MPGRMARVSVGLLMLGAGVFGRATVGFSQGGEANRPFRETFDVVSVHPSKPGSELSFGVIGNGFRARSTPLFWMILEAYCPLPMSYWKSDRVAGGPTWVRTEGFDIDARVSEAEVQEFAGLSDEEREVRVKPMLRAMLEERFGLRVHPVDRPAVLLGLVVRKGRPKLETSPSGDSVPGGIEIGDGGVMVHVPMEDGRHQLRFYRTSMARFAEALSGLGDERDLPIVDRTRLAGVYDFVLTKREGDGAAGAPNPASFWDVEALGLRLERVTGELSTVVVDRVNEPTVN